MARTIAIMEHIIVTMKNVSTPLPYAFSMINQPDSYALE